MTIRITLGNIRRIVRGVRIIELRNEIAATNLFNAKLLFCNAFLMDEGLTRKQKYHNIAQLDRCKTVRECKLVWDLLSSASAPAYPDDNAIVEVDEKMLAREIRRMREERR